MRAGFLGTAGSSQHGLRAAGAPKEDNRRPRKARPSRREAALPRALRLLRLLPLLVVLMATAPSAAAQVWSFSHTGNIVTWTVPESGTYRVIATGAQGASANPSHVGGRGARIEGEFDFVAGQVLQIAVGGQGTASHVLIDNAGNGGGGGGTFLVSDDDSPLLIAGGGGGTRSFVSQDGTDASITETA